MNLKKYMRNIIVLAFICMCVSPVNVLAVWAGAPTQPQSQPQAKDDATIKQEVAACKQRCNSSSSADKSSCLSACDAKDTTNQEKSAYCMQHPCLNSAADHGNKCCAQNGSGFSDPQYDPSKETTPTSGANVSNGNGPTLEETSYNIPSTTCGGSIELPLALATITSNAVNLGKIVVPIILIIMGMIDFFKATAASDADATSKAGKKLTRRIIAAIAAMLIVTLVQFIFSNFGTATGKTSVTSCIDCFINGNCGV